MCGRIRHSLVAQRYISNPLLLDKGNKFDFRIYMLIASVDPLIVYYHDGFLRVSLSTYDKFSKTVLFSHILRLINNIEKCPFYQYSFIKEDFLESKRRPRVSRNVRKRVKGLSDVDDGRFTKLPP